MVQPALPAVAGAGEAIDTSRPRSRTGLADTMLLLSQGLGAVTVVLGTVVLVGWTTATEGLVRVWPSSPPMYPNTALALALAGIALLVSHRSDVATRRRVGLPLAVAVVGFGALVLALNLGEVGPTVLDTALWRDGVAPATTRVPGRPVVETAAALVLLGLALVGLLDERRRLEPVAQPAALAALAIGLVALLGYAYGVDRSRLAGSAIAAIGMALPTAVALVVLAIGVLLARPRAGLVALLTAAGPGGSVSRRLLTGVLVAPLLVSGVTAAASRAAFADTPLALSLAAVVELAVLGALVVVPVRSIERFDADRADARAEAARAREALAERGPLVAALRGELVPHLTTRLGNVEVATRAEPAVGQLAGDWCDVLETGPDCVCLVLVDVAGHGAVPALFALRLKHLLTGALRAGSSPEAALASVGSAFPDDGDRIATALVLEVDQATGTCRYANAGHPPALHLTGGVADPLLPTGPLLGLPGSSWRSETFELRPGELVVAFTDGLPEAFDDDGVPFGEARLARLVVRRGPEGAVAVAEASIDAVLEHAGHRLRDDATVVVLART